MRKTIQRKWLFIAALLVVTIFSAVSAQQQPVFRIGVLDSERGPIAKGARLAVSQINARGGVIGADETPYRLELVIVPPGDDMGVALSTINDTGVIAILGPLSTREVADNSRLLPLAGVPILTPAVGDTVIVSAESDLIFRSRAAERHQGRALASFLQQDLQMEHVDVVQLDAASTEAMVGFTTAYTSLGGDEPHLHLFETGMELNDLVNEVVTDDNPQAVVTYGTPELVADFYIALRAAGWAGIFAYNNAEQADFRNRIPVEELTGVLGTATWPLGARDAASIQFLVDYVQAFGEVPGQIEAAAFDSVLMIEEAVGQPGRLEENLANIDGFRGVQGILRPGTLGLGETSDNVAVIQLGPLGGADVVARFAGTERLTDADLPVVDTGVPVPTATATLSGVYVTIQNNVQNVRTGPGLEYDVLGQMQQGETARVTGALVDFSWVVIEYRGQQGWLATYLLDLVGDRSIIPVVQPPPTPTPRPNQDQNITPTPSNFADIVIVSASPSEITFNAPTAVNVVVRNAGAIPAGPFAVAASFQPDNVYAAQNVSGLAPGAEQTVTLPVQLSSRTGFFETAIVADLNNQVNEGAIGEANNTTFVFRYRVDQPSIVQNSATLTLDQSIDLEGGTADLRLDANGLNIAGTACTTTPTPNSCIGVLGGLTWETTTFDNVSPSGGVNTTTIPFANLTQGTVIGIITAEGRRAVARVDNVAPGSSLTITYRVYQ